MPEILPIRAWRYNNDLAKKIDEITSPLFDVVTEKQLEKLYNNPYASIHLSVPKGDDPATSALNRLNEWKDDGILVQDEVPGIYVYYQHYSLPGSVNQLTRKGFIANLRLSEWEDQEVLRHEGTMPHQVNTRTDLLETTEFNFSPTHGYYTDETNELEHYMDESMQHPILSSENYQGVRDFLSVIHDRDIIKKFLKIIGERPVIMADGHHRFEASLDYWRKKRQEPGHVGKEGYNYHMMYFTNTQDENIRILPTHRLLRNIEVDEEKYLEKLRNWFKVKKVEDAFMLPEIIRGKEHAFGLLLKGNSYILKLNNEQIEELQKLDRKDQLDVSVAHRLIIGEVVGIEEQSKSRDIIYDRSFSDCYARILTGEADMAIILNEVSMTDVTEICYSGGSLPQKTTYFYPKVISGFVFSSLSDDEFKFPFNISF